MKIMRFTYLFFCVTLRPSQRAFGTYLCVYRKEDDHTAPDRKSSGWMILSAMWLRRTVSPSRRVGRGRQIHAATHFLYALFCIFSCLSACDIHFYCISSSYIHPFLYTAPSPHPVIISTYFLPQHRCFHRFFLRRSADLPRLSPSILPTVPLFFRQLCSVPRPAILTVALVPSPLRSVCSFRKPPF